MYEETDECGRATLIYPDEAITLVSVTDELTTAPAPNSGATDPVGSAEDAVLPRTMDIRHVADSGCGGCLEGAYLELDVWVPHLTTKVARVVLRDQFDLTVVDVAVPEEQMTRFVMDGDTLANRLRIELTADDGFDSAPVGDLKNVRSFTIERAGLTDLANIDPADHDQVHFIVSSMRIRRECKDCGKDPRRARRENMIVPLTPAGVEIQTVGVAPALSDGPLDVSAVIDWGCMCAMPTPKALGLGVTAGSEAGFTITMEVRRKSRFVWVAGMRFVAEDGTVLLFTEISKTTHDDNGDEVKTAEWFPLSITIKGRDNVWPAERGSVPPWHAVVPELVVDYALPSLPSEDTGVMVRNVAVMGSHEAKDTFGAYALVGPVTLYAGDGNATFFSAHEDAAAGLAVPDSASTRGTAAGWGDLSIALASDEWTRCRNGAPYWNPNVTDPCLEVEFWADVRVWAPEAATSANDVRVPAALVLVDASGQVLRAAISADSQAAVATEAYRALQQSVREGSPASPSWTTVSTRFINASYGPQFNPERIVSVSVERNGRDTDLPDEEPLETEEGAAADEAHAADLAVGLRDVRFGKPRRVGHVSDPSDYNLDDEACDPLLGWFDYSNWAPSFPVRYQHCKECCCYFDDPSSGPDYVKHCYDQGDVLSVVTPADDLAPNDQCQTCHRGNNPQVISPLNFLLPDGANPDYYPCDDDEPCSHSDRCTDAGACIADVYTSCLIADFWGGDPSKDCEMCDGTNPASSPTLGCVAKPGFFVYEPGTAGRVCGCQIDGVVWPHLGVNPDMPCQHCDVRESVTSWTNLPNDQACDITLQFDWLNLASQACTYQQTCQDGVCGGFPYTCAPLQVCEAPLDEWPNVCDLSGPASETGGCQRQLRPEGEVCRPKVHACTPAAECTGIVGTCPPQITLPGIIYDDAAKELELLLPTGEPADTEYPVIPSLDALGASFNDFRVQCGLLMLRMAIIPDGSCDVDRVSQSLGAGWGDEPFAGPVRGSMQLRPQETALGYLDDSNDVMYAFSGAEADLIIPVVPDASALVDETCDCVPDAALDLEVFRTSFELSRGALVDADGRELPFSLPLVGPADAWTRVVAELDVDAQVSVGLDWSRLAGVRLERSGPRNGTALADGAPVAFFRGLSLRSRASPPCKRAFVLEGVHDVPVDPNAGNGATFNVTSADYPASTTPSPGVVPDVSSLFDELGNDFGDDTYLSAFVKSPTGAAPIEITLLADSLEGIVMPVTALHTSSASAVSVSSPNNSPSAFGGEADDVIPDGVWLRVLARVRPGTLTANVDDITWRGITRVGLSFASAVDAGSASSILVKDVQLVSGAECVHALGALTHGHVDLYSESSEHELVLEPVAASTELADSSIGPSGTDVGAAQFDLDLTSMWDDSCSCFKDAVMELDMTVPNRWCGVRELHAVVVADNEGLHLRLPQLYNARGGAPTRGIVRVALDGPLATVVGPPTEWANVNALRFFRTLPANVASGRLGDITIHSIAVRRADVPCFSGHSLTVDVDAQERPAGRVLIGPAPVALRAGGPGGTTLMMDDGVPRGTATYDGTVMSQQDGLFLDGGAWHVDESLNDMAIVGDDTVALVGSVDVAISDSMSSVPFFANVRLPRPIADGWSVQLPAPAATAAVAYGRSAAAGAGLWALSTYVGDAVNASTSAFTAIAALEGVGGAATGNIVIGGHFSQGGPFTDVTIEGPSGWSTFDVFAAATPIVHTDALLLGVSAADGEPQWAYTWAGDGDERCESVSAIPGGEVAVLFSSKDEATAYIRMEQLALGDSTNNGGGMAGGAFDIIPSTWRGRIVPAAGDHGAAFTVEVGASVVDAAGEQLIVAGSYSDGSLEYEQCGDKGLDNIDCVLVSLAPAASDDSAAFVAAFNIADGSLLWVTPLSTSGGGGVSVHSGSSALSLSGGLVFVTGTLDANAELSLGDAGSEDHFVVESTDTVSGFVAAVVVAAVDGLPDAGAPLWTRLVRSSSGGAADCLAVVADGGSVAISATVSGDGVLVGPVMLDTPVADAKSDKVHLAASISSEATRGIVYRVHSVSGTLEWVEAFGGRDPSYAIVPSSLAVAGHGAVIAAGSLAGDVVFGEPTTTEYSAARSSISTRSTASQILDEESLHEGATPAQSFVLKFAPSDPVVQAAAAGAPSPVELALADAQLGDQVFSGVSTLGAHVVVCGTAAVGHGDVDLSISGQPLPTPTADVADATVAFLAVLERDPVTIGDVWAVGGPAEDPSFPGASVAAVGVASLVVEGLAPSGQTPAFYVALDVETPGNHLVIHEAAGLLGRVHHPGTRERVVVALDTSLDVVWWDSQSGNTLYHDTPTAVAAGQAGVAVAGVTDAPTVFYGGALDTRSTGVLTLHDPLTGEATLHATIGGDGVEATMTSVAVNGGLIAVAGRWRADTLAANGGGGDFRLEPSLHGRLRVPHYIGHGRLGDAIRSAATLVEHPDIDIDSSVTVWVGWVAVYDMAGELVSITGTSSAGGSGVEALEFSHGGALLACGASDGDVSVVRHGGENVSGAAMSVDASPWTGTSAWAASINPATGNPLWTTGFGISGAGASGSHASCAALSSVGAGTSAVAFLVGEVGGNAPLTSADGEIAYFTKGAHAPEPSHLVTLALNPSTGRLLPSGRGSAGSEALTSAPASRAADAAAAATTVAAGARHPHRRTPVAVGWDDILGGVAFDGASQRLLVVGATSSAVGSSHVIVDSQMPSRVRVSNAGGRVSGTGWDPAVYACSAPLALASGGSASARHARPSSSGVALTSSTVSDAMLATAQSHLVDAPLPNGFATGISLGAQVSVTSIIFTGSLTIDGDTLSGSGDDSDMSAALLVHSAADGTFIGAFEIAGPASGETARVTDAAAASDGASHFVCGFADVATATDLTLSGAIVSVPGDGGRDGFVARISDSDAAAGTDAADWFVDAASLTGNDDAVHGIAVGGSTVVAVGQAAGAVPVVAGDPVWGGSISSRTIATVIALDAASGAELWGKGFAVSSSTGQAVGLAAGASSDGAFVAVGGAFRGGALTVGDDVLGRSGSDDTSSWVAFVALLDGTDYGAPIWAVAGHTVGSGINSAGNAQDPASLVHGISVSSAAVLAVGEYSASQFAFGDGFRPFHTLSGVVAPEGASTAGFVAMLPTARQALVTKQTAWIDGAGAPQPHDDDDDDDASPEPVAPASSAGRATSAVISNDGRAWVVWSGAGRHSTMFGAQPTGAAAALHESLGSWSVFDASASGKARSAVVAYTSDGSIGSSEVLGAPTTGATIAFAVGVNAGGRVAVAGWRAGNVRFLSDRHSTSPRRDVEINDVPLGRSLLAWQPFTALMAPVSLTHSAGVLAVGQGALDVAQGLGASGGDLPFGPVGFDDVTTATAAVGRHAVFVAATRVSDGRRWLAASNGGDFVEPNVTLKEATGGAANSERTLIMGRDRRSGAHLWTLRMTSLANATSAEAATGAQWHGHAAGFEDALWPDAASVIADMASSPRGTSVCIAGHVDMGVDLSAGPHDLAALYPDTNFAVNVLGALANLTAADATGQSRLLSVVSCWCDDDDTTAGGSGPSRMCNSGSAGLGAPLWSSVHHTGDAHWSKGAGVAISRNIVWVAGSFAATSFSFGRADVGTYGVDSDANQNGFVDSLAGGDAAHPGRCFVAGYDAATGLELGAHVFGSEVPGATCEPSDIVVSADGKSLWVAGVLNAGVDSVANVVLRTEPTEVSVTPAAINTDTPFLVRFRAAELAAEVDEVLAPVFAVGADTSGGTSNGLADGLSLAASGNQLYMSGAFHTTDIDWMGTSIASAAAAAGGGEVPTACFVTRLTFSDLTDNAVELGTVELDWIAALSSSSTRDAVHACGSVVAASDGRVHVALASTQDVDSTTSTSALAPPAWHGAAISAPVDGASFGAVAQLSSASGQLVAAQVFGPSPDGSSGDAATVLHIAAAPAEAQARLVGGAGSSLAVVVGAYHGSLQCDAATDGSGLNGYAALHKQCLQHSASGFGDVGHEEFEYALFVAPLNSGSAYSGSIGDPVLVTQSAESIDSVRGYVMQMELWLEDADRPLLGGEWRSGDGSGPGVVFDLDEAAQRAVGSQRWMLAEAPVRTVMAGHRGDVDFGTLGGAALLESLPFFGLRAAAAAGDGGSAATDAALWYVRNVKLLKPHGDCAPCGRAPIHTDAIAVEPDVVVSAKSVHGTVPLCSLEAAVGSSVLPVLPVDLSLLVDPSCNCLRDVSIRWMQQVGGEDGGPDVRIVRVELLGGGGYGDGGIATWGSVQYADQATLDAATGSYWLEASVDVSVSDHVAVSNVDWSVIDTVNLFADASACGADPVLPVVLRSIAAERLCPRADTHLHPRPESPEFTGTRVALTRSGLGMASASSYRVLAVETNMYGDDSTPTCSPAFVADDTAPAVTDATAIDLLPELGAEESTDVDITQYRRFKVGWNGAFAEDESAPDNILLFRIGKVTAGSPDGPEVPGLVSEEKLLAIASNGYVSTTADQDDLEDGVVHFVHLDVCNRGKLCSTVATDGIMVDASPPYPVGGAAGLRDVGGNHSVDIDHQFGDTQLTAAWDGFDDPHSGIAEVRIGVGTAEFGTDVHEFDIIDVDARSHTFGVPDGEVAYLHGQIYYVVWRVFNTAGGFADYRTDGVYIDQTPPEVLHVTDVVSREIEGLESYYEDTSAVGDVDVHDGSYVRAKFLCDDPESIAGGARGTARYRWRVCTTPTCDESDDDNVIVMDWRDEGVSPRGSSFPATLPDNATEFFVHMECTNPIGLFSEGFSDGAVVDLTPPDNSSAFVREVQLDKVLNEYIYGVDIDFVATESLAMEWGGFTTEPNAPPIVSYHFGVSTTPAINEHDVPDMQPFTPSPEGGTTAETDPAAYPMDDATLYYVTVRAYASNGAFSTAVSDGVTTDFTEPKVQVQFASPTAPDGDTKGPCPNMQCVALADADDLPFLARRDLFAFNVTDIVSAPAPVETLKYGVSTCDAILDYNAFPLTTADEAEAMVVDLSGLNLFHSLQYCAVVWVVNSAGGASVNVSEPVTIDLTPPLDAFVNEGLSPVLDDDAVSTTDSLSITVGCVDHESGVHHHEVRLWQQDDDAENGRQTIVDWTDIGSLRSVTLTSLSMTHAERYYTTVRCFNSLGSYVDADSDGFVVDTTPPNTTQAVVLPGAGGADDLPPHALGVSVTHIPSRDALAASWHGFFDPESEIREFRWSIGTAPGLEDVRPTVSAGPSPVAEAAGLNLVDGNTYYVTVYAVNSAGLMSSSSSAAITVDSTAPNAGGEAMTVSVDATGDGLSGYIASTSEMSLTWTSLEPDSDVEHFVALGTSSFGEQEREWVSAGVGNSGAVLTDLSLTPGTEYYVSLRAVNEAGLATMALSAPVMCDPLPPLEGRVFDGVSPLAAVVATSADDELRCSWNGWHDEISGIAFYRVGFGTAPGATDVVPAEVVSEGEGGAPAGAGAFSKDSLTLTPGTRYHCVVSAFDHAGNAAVVSSPGVVVDTSAPVAGTVRDNPLPASPRPLPDVDHQVEQTTVGVSWGGFSDPESGIFRFSWAAGTSAGASDIVPWRFVDSHVTSARVTNLDALDVGTTVFVSVRAYNILSDITEVSSDGVTVVPPLSSVGESGMDAATFVGFIPSVASTGATWCECVDGNALFDPASGTCSCAPGFVLDPTAAGEGRAAACVACDNTTFAVGVEGGCKPSLGNGADLCHASLCGAPDEDVSALVPVDMGALVECGGPPPTDHVPSAVATVLDGDANCVCPPGARYLPETHDVHAAACVPCGTRVGVSSDSELWAADSQRYAAGASLDHECASCNAASNADVVLSVVWSEAEVSSGVIVDHYLVSVGTSEGAARWTRSVAPNPAADGEPPRRYHAQFTSRGNWSSNPPLHHGATLHVLLRAVTSEGLVLGEDRMHTVVDVSPPVGGVVYDGAADLSDARVLSVAGELAASWDGFEDDLSEIVLYEVAYGTEHGASDLTDGLWFDVGTSTGHAVTLSDLGMPNLAEGTAVFATVRAYNAHGAFVDAFSDGAVVQSVLPGGVAVVHGDDGRGLDATPYPHRHSVSQASRQYIAAAWLFANTTAGLAVDVDETADGRDTLSLTYTWLVQDADSGADVMAASHVGTATAARAVFIGDGGDSISDDGSVSVLDSELEFGHRYVVIVTATNEAGVSEQVTSLPVLVDNTPPNDGTVTSLAMYDAAAIGDPARAIEGPQGELYQTSQEGLSVSWSFEDDISDITSVTVAIGGVVGGLRVLWQEGVSYESGEAPSANATFSGLGLVHGECYIVQVSASDEAGLRSLFAQGQLTCVDITRAEASVRVSPDLVTDEDVALVGVMSDAEAAVAVGPVVASALFASEHADGHAVPVVFARPGTNGTGTGNATTVHVRAVDFESGLSSVELVWADTADVPSDEAAWVSVPVLTMDATGVATLDAGWTLGDLLAEHPPGTLLYPHWRVYNGAGVMTAAVSGAALAIDDSPPTIVGSGVVVPEFQRATDSVSVSWSFAEDESVLAGHIVSIHSDDDVDEVVAAPRWYGRDTRAVVEGLSLVSGSTYRVRITACNVVSLCTVAEATFVVDTTAPRVGVVHAGIADAALVDDLCDDVHLNCTAPTPISVPAGGPSAEFISFAGFADDESGVAEYVIAVGTSPFGSQLGDAIVIAGDETDAEGSHTLALGDVLPEDARTLYDQEQLYVSITAANGAGVRASLVAPLFVVDALAPPVGLVSFAGTAFPKASILQLSPTNYAGDLVREVPFGLRASDAVLVSVQQDVSGGADVVQVAWTAFSDGVEDEEDSGVAAHTVVVRASLSGAIVGGPVEVDGDALTATVTGVDLEPDTLYTATVTASDAAGNEATVRSTTMLVVDDTPPEGTCLPIDGIDRGFDVDCQPRGGTEPLVDPDVDVTALSEEEAAQIAALEKAWHVRDLRAPPPAIVVVQPQPPLNTDPNVDNPDQGLEVPHEDYTVVSVMWCPFVDPDSGIASVHVALGTTRGGDDVASFEEVPGKRNAVQFVLPLQKEGTELYGAVRAINAVGLETTLATDGVRVLCTPGTPYCEYDGTFLCVATESISPAS